MDSETTGLKKALFSVLKYVFLIFISFWCLVPLYACFVTAFKTQSEYQNTNIMTFPRNWLYFGNFVTAWKDADMGLAFFNSALILVVVLVCTIFFSSSLAYALSRFKFPGNGVVRNLFLFATFVPGVAMQVTVYQLMNNLHLINTLYGYMILMMGTDIISIYIFIQFFSNLPESLDESGILDGCTYFGVFFKILLPNLKPAVVTCLLLKGVGVYNEFYMANLYLQDKTTLQVISTCLYTFTGPLGSQYNLICAGVIMSILPALVIFIAFQKQIYNGLISGAVKG